MKKLILNKNYKKLIIKPINKKPVLLKFFKKEIQIIK